MAVARSGSGITLSRERVFEHTTAWGRRAGTEMVAVVPGALINGHHEAWSLDHGRPPGNPPADDPHVP